MAGNFGKFIDRTPIICAAGKISGDATQTVASCLQDYKLDCQVAALQHDAGIFEEHKPPFLYKLPVLKNFRHCGIYTESKPILQPPVKTRYQTLINDLKETSYDSYWHKSEGKTRDPLPGLPAGMDTLQTTFGAPTIRLSSVKELVNPPKTVTQVLWDSQIGHDMYKKTHNDYNPGEQVERGYLKLPFNPNKRYGERTIYDPRGIWVRCACHWHNNEPLTSVNITQADVLERTKPQLGKVLAPIKNIESVPKGHMFGKPSNREMYGVPELLKDVSCPPCIFKRDFHEWMKLLNELRIYAKKRFNKYGFDLKMFHDRNLYYDKEHTGWVPLQIFYDICECYDLRYEHESLEPLFKFLGVIKDDNINYRDFVFLADINTSVPEIIKIEDVPNSSEYYITTSLASACDFITMDNSNMPAAGVPGIRFDLAKPTVPEGGCRADLESLGDETSAGAIINPCIYSNYGLSYRDFFTPRSPEIIRKIFENIGYQFPDNTFEKLWKIGLERDKTGLVCVDTFKHLMKETVPPPQVTVKHSEEC